jgi:hypothetical protein
MLSVEAILAAKREVLTAQGRGLLYSPEEAWAVAGRREMETLWSIANRVGLLLDQSPEELCGYLEGAFPHCSFHRSRIDTSIWDRGDGFI